ncbi:YbdD/YjiX family protein [Immundisolibacter sp.]|uniref:YbdD/YjiX family protein n=1 Tax=Immundisolibacter sp. TaxID=1934948 RepID=UPI002610CD1A|nr:YbdD/YjiX family protein [Immundisolibacter sp.]MDD3650443.1 YbdD/YjiX family protein [Immundisolibacter sp.]
MNALRALWRWLRAVSGDDAYERYLVHHALAHPDRPPLDRRAYFRRCQDEVWSRLRRCC